LALPQFIKQIVSSNSTSTQLVKVLDSLINNLNDIFTAILKKEQLDSVILQQVNIVVGLNQIPHTLGRTLTGWKVTRIRNGYCMLYDVQENNPSTDRYLYLISANAGTVDLEVF
jgi:hypothetical protein